MTDTLKMFLNILSFVCDARRRNDRISQNFKTNFATQIVRYFTLLQNEKTWVRNLYFDYKEIKRKFGLNKLKMWWNVDFSVFVVYNRRRPRVAKNNSFHFAPIDSLVNAYVSDMTMRHRYQNRCQVVHCKHGKHNSINVPPINPDISVSFVEERISLTRRRSSTFAKTLFNSVMLFSWNGK